MPHVPIFASERVRGSQGAGLYARRGRGAGSRRWARCLTALTRQRQSPTARWSSSSLTTAPSSPTARTPARGGPLREGQAHAHSTAECACPASCAGPATSPAGGRQRDEPVMAIDLLPTLAKLLKVEPAARRRWRRSTAAASDALMLVRRGARVLAASGACLLRWR